MYAVLKFSLILIHLSLSFFTGRVHPLAEPDTWADSTTYHIDHTLFDALLAQHVNAAGEVDYAAIKAGEGLQHYIAVLEQADPAQLSENEALAFWLNAYNAYTLKLIVDRYPVKSIKEITPLRIKGLALAVPKLNSPFEYSIATIAGKKLSLDDIEHKIIRKQFDEPRIHFALVCAAVSCPPLRREAYVASRLDAQLDDQARAFLFDETKNRVDTEKRTLYLSRIFKWFKSDFTSENRTLQQFLAPYYEGEAAAYMQADGYKVRYRKYNWALNDIGSMNN
ncbi:MAG: DUF547 domain-containing protein [Bacteroidota bacterium]